jgi:hypothetical protein
MQYDQPHRIQQCLSVYQIKTEELQELLGLIFEIPNFRELHSNSVYNSILSPEPQAPLPLLTETETTRRPIIVYLESGYTQHCISKFNAKRRLYYSKPSHLHSCL